MDFKIKKYKNKFIDGVIAYKFNFFSWIIAKIENAKIPKKIWPISLADLIYDSDQSTDLIIKVNHWAAKWMFPNCFLLWV